MAMVTTSPATLQPSSSCKQHASHGAARCCPPPLLSWKRRSSGQQLVTTVRATAASSRGQPTMGVAGVGEEGDSIRRLQNGSDVRGVALEGEKGRAVDLTPLAVEAIAESFGEWVREELRLRGEEPQQQLRVSVGRDPRLSGPRLSAALFGGLARAGCAVFDMGLATTPACFMSTILPRLYFATSQPVRQLVQHLTLQQAYNSQTY